MSIFIANKVTRRYDNYKEINQLIDEIELLRENSLTGNGYYDFHKLQSLRKRINQCVNEYIPENINKIQYDTKGISSKDKKPIIKNWNDMKGYFNLYNYQLNALNEQARRKYNSRGVRHKHMKQNERSIKNWLF